MSKRGPDHQKREAKRSLWDADGHHVPKKYRNKGRGRRKDKKEINASQAENEYQGWVDWEEVDLALYCHNYGPCASCLANEAIEENKELLDRLDDDVTETQE